MIITKIDSNVSTELTNSQKNAGLELCGTSSGGNYDETSVIDCDNDLSEILVLVTNT